MKFVNAWGRAELCSSADQWNVHLGEGVRELWRSHEAPSLAGAAPRDAPEGLAGDVVRRTLDLLYAGPGVALVHGAPVKDEDEACRWLWSFGTSLGSPVPQNLDGVLIGRVEDAGADHANPTHRGHKTSAALAFHADRTDVIALLCVRDATDGGLSQLASAAKVRQVLAAEAPDLLEVLEQPLPHDRRGEEAPGESPWCSLPVFSRDGDRVVCRYIRRFVESSQRHANAPRLTRQQVRAMDAVDQILTRADVVYEMDLQPGQVQLIENHSVMHARSAFADSGRAGGRLLLRLWLSTAQSPELPASFGPVYGATGRGTVRGGVWPPGTAGSIGRSLCPTR